MKKILLAMCALPFFASANNVAKCDDGRVVTELQRIAKQATVKELRNEAKNHDISQVVNKLSFKAKNIISKGYAEKRKANVCEADLSMLLDNNEMQSYPVYYSVTSSPKSSLGFTVKMILKE
jgi:hypothetical protein